MNSLTPYKKLGLTQKRLDILDKFIKYKKEVESFEDELKENFKKLVEDGTIPTTSIDLGNIVLSYTKSYTKKQIDSQKLKDDNIYDKYTKENTVKSSVSMKIKKEETKDE